MRLDLLPKRMGKSRNNWTTSFNKMWYGKGEWYFNKYFG